MIVHQLSIFLENKFGKLSELLALLGSENIRIIAATVADTSEFGILRLIVTDPEKAYAIFQERGVGVNMTEVLAIKSDAQPGRFAQIISQFTQAGVSIEYMYCFSLDKQSIMIIRTNNKEAAFEVIRKHQIDHVNACDLINL
jgi:hypothetical protein